MRIRNLEKNIIKGLENRAEDIIKEFGREPYMCKRDYRKALSKKMRVNKPLADNIMRLLEARGKINKKKRSYSYF